MITIKNITKNFTKTTKQKQTESFTAIDNISFEAKEGKILGILGPNGAGKTTLLRTIAGIMEPSSGSISIDNQNYQENEVEIKKKIAYLSGNTKIYGSISPYELLKMCANIYDVPLKDTENRIKEIANILKMNNFLHNRIEKLSTGQTQRVNIARCLIHNPQYYILDEATSGLDIITSQIILDFIKEERKKGKTILYSTHYMEEAENICDEIIMINKGKILTTGTPEEIKKKTKTTNLRDAFFTLIGDNYE